MTEGCWVVLISSTPTSFVVFMACCPSELWVGYEGGEIVWYRWGVITVVLRVDWLSVLVILMGGTETRKNNVKKMWSWLSLGSWVSHKLIYFIDYRLCYCELAVIELKIRGREYLYCVSD